MNDEEMIREVSILKRQFNSDVNSLMQTFIRTFNVRIKDLELKLFREVNKKQNGN